MSSTSTSNILEVANLNVVFKVRHYQQRTLRDRFVSTLRDPVEALLRSPESLHILKNVRLEMKRGDRLAILGVNGGGKTTLCRCIAQMIHPTSGSIQIRGSSRAVFNASVAVIPELTGRENARLLALLLYPNMSPYELEEVIAEAVQFAELGNFIDAPYETYSQGMKARLCLSIATAKSCDLLILDEVYDNTDTFFQEKLRGRMKTFIEESGAVIFVSHSPELVKATCNRAIVLHESQIKFDGDVDRALQVYRFLNHPLEN
jgi:ABC-type polysaccharide/polyol phosphate transport system ATPase subunit